MDSFASKKFIAKVSLELLLLLEK